MNYLESFFDRNKRSRTDEHAEEPVADSYNPGRLVGRANPLAYLVATPSDTEHFNSREDDTWRFATEKETRDMQAIESSSVATRQHPRRDGIIPPEDNFYHAPCVYTTVLHDNGIQARYIYDLEQQRFHDIVRIRPPRFLPPSYPTSHADRLNHNKYANFYNDIMRARLDAGDDIQERPQRNAEHTVAGPGPTRNDLIVPAADVFLRSSMGSPFSHQPSNSLNTFRSM